MRRRIILHVGPHKTGSTYLQKRLVENRPQLRERDILIPRTGWVPHGHHNLVNVLRGWAPSSAECSLDTLKQEIAESPTSLLTSENFILLEDSQLRLLAEGLSDFDVTVVFFLRHPVNVWPSHWQELIKHGYDITFADYMLGIHGHRDQTDTHPAIQDRQLRRLSNAFGIGNLKVVVYENVVGSGADLFDFFWRHVLGASRCEFRDEPGSVNESLAPDQVEIIRQLNDMFAREFGLMAKYTLRMTYLRQVFKTLSLDDRSSFTQEFEKCCASLKLSGQMPVVSSIYRNILAEFASTVVNRQSDAKILVTDPADRLVRYGSRDWIYNSNQVHYVRHVYRETLSLMTGQRGQEESPR